MLEVIIMVEKNGRVIKLPVSGPLHRTFTDEQVKLFSVLLNTRWEEKMVWEHI